MVKENYYRLKMLLKSFFNSFKNIREKKQLEDKIIAGIILLIISLILPGLIWNRQYNVLDNIYKSITSFRTCYLLLASAELILLNSIRHFPVYIGTFLIADGFRKLLQNNRNSNSVSLNSNFKKVTSRFYIIPLFLIPFIMYNLISGFYNISFVFTGSSLLSTIIVILVHKFAKDIGSLSIKIIIASLFILSFSWLEIIPFLSQFGFGSGELAISIIHTADVIGATRMLNIIGILIFGLIIINAVILSKVVFYYNKYLSLLKMSKVKDSRIDKMRAHAIESRYFSEIKQLVHDLKTPLNTIQTLSGVINMRVKDKKVKEYTGKIVNSTEKLSKIISEVLLENSKEKINFRDMLNLIKSQISLKENYKSVSFEIQLNTFLEANRFRLTRAIINLIDNAIKSIKNKEKGEVEVIFTKNKNDLPEIIVKDNGKGISEVNLDKIWEAGFSTSLENTGLGLNFVKQVMDDHNGKIYIESEVGIGTEVHLIFPEVDNFEENREKCSSN